MITKQSSSHTSVLSFGLPSEAQGIGLSAPSHVATHQCFPLLSLAASSTLFIILFISSLAMIQTTVYIFFTPWFRLRVFRTSDSEWKSQFPSFDSSVQLRISFQHKRMLCPRSIMKGAGIRIVIVHLQTRSQITLLTVVNHVRCFFMHNNVFFE